MPHALCAMLFAVLARSIVAHMAVEETGHAATDVARYLGIKQTSVLQSVKKGRILSAGIGQEA